MHLQSKTAIGRNGLIKKTKFYIIMKALSGFLLTQTDDTECVRNVRKLHWPSMSDAFSADSVNMTLASLYSCTTAAMFSEFHGD